jgi:elongation factor P
MVVAAIVIALLAGANAYKSIAPSWIARPSTALHLTTADFKNGMTFEIDGVPLKLLEFLHVKPGKGSAFVRSKVKNLLNGSVQERTFRAGEGVTAAEINKVEMQYTYTDGESLCFMNSDTLEEERIEKNKVENAGLLKEGLLVTMLCWNDKIIDVSLPQQVVYKVADCPPNFKGNSGGGVTKPATLDCGAVVQVPMFIEIGENIVVSTEDCKYMGREGK